MKRQLSAAQEEFRSEVQDFLAARQPELDDQSESHFESLVRFQRHLHEAGLAVVAWPREYGGRGLSPVEYAIVCEELGSARAPEVINFVGIDVLAPALLEFAEPEKLRRWLPPMASADEIWCQMFSEPDAGSDLTSLRASAVRVANGWKVSGQKVWSTWAQHATFGLLLARTGSSDSRHRGISAFVVDMALPGIEVRPLKTMTGVSEFAEVFFDDAVLPADALVGALDGGWTVAQRVLVSERGPYAIRRAAVLRGALAGLRELANKASRRNPLQSELLVRACIDMELLDLRIDEVLEKLTGNVEIGNEAALTKLLMSRFEQRLFSAAVSILDMSSIAWDHDDVETTAWIEHYLYSRASTIYGGTWEIQHNIIGERLLDLPRS
jgi:alkylation response protein AidB-like acyl-CoA dehydrogenase